jgi:cyanophycinase
MSSRTERSRASDGRIGHLVIIGGGEDRKRDKEILSRFIDLAGGRRAKIVVLTAASTVQKEMWGIYDEAFGALGVGKRVHMAIRTRQEAGDPARAEEMLSADGVFMTGGDQKRLLATIGGTLIDSAMHRAFKTRGVCIAGTSAGASAISEHMLAASSAGDAPPAKGETHLAAGLGFLQRVVIDQHFSERHRLGRLLGVVAQNPYLLGIGIDEDTALVVESGAGLEVLGHGAVTLIDGREMLSNFLDVAERERMELVNVKLHLLPSGARYYLNGNDGVPPALRDAVAAVTSVSTLANPAFPSSLERRHASEAAAS